jgi:hypothetical protein
MIDAGAEFSVVIYAIWFSVLIDRASAYSIGDYALDNTAITKGS